MILLPPPLLIFMYLIAHTCTHLTNIIIKLTIFTKILITIRHLQNKAIEFLYVFVFVFVFV